MGKNKNNGKQKQRLEEVPEVDEEDEEYEYYDYSAEGSEEYGGLADMLGGEVQDNWANAAVAGQNDPWSVHKTVQQSAAGSQWGNANQWGGAIPTPAQLAAHHPATASAAGGGKGGGGKKGNNQQQQKGDKKGGGKGGGAAPHPQAWQSWGMDNRHPAEAWGAGGANDWALTPEEKAWEAAQASKHAGGHWTGWGEEAKRLPKGHDVRAAYEQQKGGHEKGGQWDQWAGQQKGKGGGHEHKGGGQWDQWGGQEHKGGGQWDQWGGHEHKGGGQQKGKGGGHEHRGGGQWDQLGGQGDQLGGQGDQLGGRGDQWGGQGDQWGGKQKGKGGGHEHKGGGQWDEWGGSQRGGGQWDEWGAAQQHGWDGWGGQPEPQKGGEQQKKKNKQNKQDNQGNKQEKQKNKKGGGGNQQQQNQQKQKKQQQGDEWGIGGGGWDDGRGWGMPEEEDNYSDYDDMDRRVQFAPISSNLWGGSDHESTYRMPSKTLTHAYKGTNTPLFSGAPRNKVSEGADVNFIDSKGAALQTVLQAFFGKARKAKDRIHWMFPPNKDERVVGVLTWIEVMSHNLGAYGLHRFLQSRERGALFVNADYRPPHNPNEPAFDWLTFDQLQATRDRTLQESVAFYDPSVTTVVFVFLPSKTGNSVAMWRRRITVGNNTRTSRINEINIAMAGLRREKDYVVHVDEIPGAKKPAGDKKKAAVLGPDKRNAALKHDYYYPYDAYDPKPKKRRWWQFLC